MNGDKDMLGTKNNSARNGIDDFDVLFSAWILSCNDDNPLITYEGIKYRLGLPAAINEIKELISSRGELFRKGAPTYRIETWKAKLQENPNSLPAHIRAIENPSDRKKAIDSLTTNDVFRNQFRTGENADRCSIEIIDWGLQHIERRRKASVESREISAKWKIPLLTAFLSVITTLLITYFASQWTLSNQIKISNIQKRQQVFGEIMGQKSIMKQLYVSRFKASIFSDYHEAKWRKANSPNNSIDLQEAQRWMRKSEDLALEIARSNQSLFEKLGLIRAVFSPSAKLNQLTDRLYHFKTPKILGDPFAMDNIQIEQWKLKAVKDLQSLVDQEYGAPIDELVEHLSNELSRE